jgi:hypothetical protein
LALPISHPKIRIQKFLSLSSGIESAVPLPLLLFKMMPEVLSVSFPRSKASEKMMRLSKT